MESFEYDGGRGGGGGGGVGGVGGVELAAVSTGMGAALLVSACFMSAL